MMFLDIYLTFKFPITIFVTILGEGCHNQSPILTPRCHSLTSVIVFYISMDL